MTNSIQSNRIIAFFLLVAIGATGAWWGWIIGEASIEAPVIGTYNESCPLHQTKMGMAMLQFGPSYAADENPTYPFGWVPGYREGGFRKVSDNWAWFWLCSQCFAMRDGIENSKTLDAPVHLLSGQRCSVHGCLITLAPQSISKSSLMDNKWKTVQNEFPNCTWMGWTEFPFDEPSEERSVCWLGSCPDCEKGGIRAILNALR